MNLTQDHSVVAVILKKPFTHESLEDFVEYTGLHLCENSYMLGDHIRVTIVKKYVVVICMDDKYLATAHSFILDLIALQKGTVEGMTDSFSPLFEPPQHEAPISLDSSSAEIVNKIRRLCHVELNRLAVHAKSEAYVYGRMEIFCADLAVDNKGVIKSIEQRVLIQSVPLDIYPNFFDRQYIRTVSYVQSHLSNFWSKCAPMNTFTMWLDSAYQQYAGRPVANKIKLKYQCFISVKLVDSNTLVLRVEAPVNPTTLI